MKHIFPMILLLSLPAMASAQLQFWQGGVFGGISNYLGDIVPTSTPDFSDTGLSFGLVARTDISERIGFRGSLVYAGFAGDDANYEIRQDRGFKFETDFFELAGVFEWEPFGNNRFYADAAGNIQMDRLISPYLFGGIAVGLASLNTDFSGYTGDSANTKRGIQLDRNMGSSATSFAIPIGVGVKFDVSVRFTVALEVSGRYAFSDYLDGVSEAGSPTASDIYYISGLMVYYRFEGN